MRNIRMRTYYDFRPGLFYKSHKCFHLLESVNVYLSRILIAWLALKHRQSGRDDYAAIDNQPEERLCLRRAQVDRIPNLIAALPAGVVVREYCLPVFLSFA